MASTYDTGLRASLRILGLMCLGVMLLALGCASSGSSGKSSDPAAHFHFRSAATIQEKPHPWAVLLPGSSGLKIFEDDQHYFRAAEALNAAGFDALVVDYKPAYRAYSDAPDVSTGEKIKWVTGKAIEWAKANQHFGANAPGAIIAWSLGGEGLWKMVADAGWCAKHGVRAASAYYPSNQDEQKLASHVPLLILTGEADDVVEVKDVRSLVAQRDRAAPGEVTLTTYPGAHHGFDIASLTKKRTMELIPIIGPRATFQYDRAAAEEAGAALVKFLAQQTR